MNILENISLAAYNTFGLPARARYFAQAATLNELAELLAFARQRSLAVIPLGAGSNVILSGHLDGLVIHLKLCGRSVLDTGADSVRVVASAGENWHAFVRWSLSVGAFGLENLSLIPGTVGAAPIQNIGAYGVELKDRFYALEAMAVDSGQRLMFGREDCAFGYRDSAFKNHLKDRYIITSVQFELDRVFQPRLDYGALADRLQAGACASQVSDTICAIRREKLPDPQALGNAGSFFKNPQVDSATLHRLKQTYPDMVAFAVGDGQWKLAAGWLIEKAGLKGFRQGAVGTYAKQALVLVNHGGASGDEVLRFATLIQDRVRARFGVILEREPRIF